MNPIALIAFCFVPVVASIFVLAGSVIWTDLIKRVGDINSWMVQPGQVPLGIKVSTGTALHYAWAAFAILVTSLIPHMFLSVSFFPDLHYSCALIYFYYPVTAIAEGVDQPAVQVMNERDNTISHVRIPTSYLSVYSCEPYPFSRSCDHFPRSRLTCPRSTQRNHPAATVASGCFRYLVLLPLSPPCQPFSVQLPGRPSLRGPET